MIAAISRSRAARRTSRPALTRLVGTELRKNVDTRSGQVIVGLLVLLVLTTAGYLVVEQPADEPVLAARFLSVPWSVVRMVLPVVGVLSMTTEWSGRTASSIFTLVPRRGRVVAAKLGAALTMAVTMVLAMATVAVPTAALAGALTGQSVQWAGLSSGVGGALVGGVCFMGLGVAIGVLLQHTAAALVCYFVAPTLVTLTGSALVGDRVGWVAVTPAIVRLESLDLRGAVASSITALVAWILLPFFVGVVRWLRREVP